MANLTKQGVIARLIREMMMIEIIMHHKHLGDVLITENCLAMQAMNPDSTSMFVKHDGDIKEVTRSLVEPKKWQEGMQLFDLARLPPPDEMGFFMHPDIPGEEESDDVRAMMHALGFEISGVSFEFDAPDELVEVYFEHDDLTAPTLWTPTPPDGDGWILIGKYDTDDGPMAMFIRKIP